MPIFERFYREVEQVYPNVPDKLKFNETLKRVLNRFVDDLIRTTQARVTAAEIRTLDDVRNHPNRLAAFSPAVDAERKQNKDFLYKTLYYSPALSEEKDEAERVVRDLFTFWMSHPEALPHNYQDRAHEDPLPRVICDYIAGMTDPFILEQHEKHCGK